MIIAFKFIGPEIIYFYREINRNINAYIDENIENYMYKKIEGYAKSLKLEATDYFISMQLRYKDMTEFEMGTKGEYIKHIPI